MTMDNWQVIKQEIKFDHPWMRMLVETLERDGETKPYYYLESQLDAVAVVAVTDQGRMLVTQQYRHPTGKVILDLPGGRTDKDEDPEKAVRRELREETGYEAGRLEWLGTLNPFPGSLKIMLHLYFAGELSEAGRQELDPDEELLVHQYPFDTVYEEVLAGQHIDGALYLGVLLARAKGLA